MARPVHFEIHAEDPERAIAFYETALGWSFSEVMPGAYWLITTGAADKPGINGGLKRRKSRQSGERRQAAGDRLRLHHGGQVA